jgi:hypothetical protein
MRFTVFLFSLYIDDTLLIKLFNVYILRDEAIF